MEHLFRFAYLDPGTGSMVIQSLIGIAAGIALFGRRALNAVRSRLKGNKAATAASESKDTAK